VVVATRVRPPWVFDVRAPNRAVVACATAVDRAANPSTACVTVPVTRPSCHEWWECPSFDEYCAKPAGDCVGPGQCRQLPDVCADVEDPACGCDGMTYSNECYAAAAGQNVLHRGPCP
jgi:hypothetical protein